MVIAIRNILLAFFAVILCLVSFSTVASAQSCSLKAGNGALAIPTWYQYLPAEIENGECQVKEGLGGRYVILILMGVFDILLFLAGFLAVLIFIWGGFKFLTSNGEPNNISAARTTLLNAVVGLAIAILASQIVGFIARTLA